MNQSQDKSKSSTMKYIENTVIKKSQFIGTTETVPALRIHTSIVFYIVVGLLAVFVIIAIFYGVSYCQKLYAKGKRNTTNIDGSNNLHYEDLPGSYRN